MFRDITTACNPDFFSKAEIVIERKEVWNNRNGVKKNVGAIVRKNVRIFLE